MRTFLRTGLVFLFSFLIFIPIQKAYAEGVVVINEFLVDPDSDQWVELYNKGNASVDVGGWYIDDDGGTQKFTIPTGTSLNPGEFKIFESSSFNLNRTSADQVRLLNGSSQIDSYSYQTGPGTNHSYGRNTDGGDNWVAFNSPTKGSSNNSAASSPIPTPTSPPTPTPTKVPTPTKIPNPIKSGTTPTKSPTPTKSITSPTTPTSPKTTIANTSKTTPTAKPINLSGVPTSVLGTSSKSTDKKPEDSSKSKKVLVASANQNYFRYIALSIGLISLAAAAFYFVRTRNKQES